MHAYSVHIHIRIHTQFHDHQMRNSCIIFFPILYSNLHITHLYYNNLAFFFSISFHYIYLSRNKKNSCIFKVPSKQNNIRIQYTHHQQQHLNNKKIVEIFSKYIIYILQLIKFRKSSPSVAINETNIIEIIIEIDCFYSSFLKLKIIV